MSTATPSVDRQWYILGRWQEFEGEARANLLRVAGIAAFYGIELLNYHGLHLGFLHMPRAENVSREFHLAVTYLAVAWVMVGLGVHVCMRRQMFPAALKFVSTGCDLVLLTAILTLADGPRSPLVAAYFLIVALATLRLNLPLVRFATIVAVLGYLILLGHDKWFREPRPDALVPRYHQLIVLVSLALTGILLGQVIRRAQHLAREYARRLENTV